MQWRCFGRVFYFPKTLAVLLAVVVCAGLVTGGYFLLENPQEEGIVLTANPASGTPTATASGTDGSEATGVTPKAVFWEIYIVGAVQYPGIYALEEGALMHDAVEVAGGLLQSVDPATVNMVQELQDNLMIHILTEEQRTEQGRDSSLVLVKNGAEIAGSQSGSGNSTGTGEKININSADKEALMSLPGIGEARAESIIAYREEHGPFATIEDIMQVSGIKESAFAKIKDRITT